MHVHTGTLMLVVYGLYHICCVYRIVWGWDQILLLIQLTAYHCVIDYQGARTELHRLHEILQEYEN